MEARMSAVLPRLGASLPLPPDLDMCRRVAEHAEILGYESLWIADTGAGPDAFVVAAVAAGVTRRARIGTAVIPVYTRALPVHAAGAGSVAQLAPGRFVLGLGVSSETIVDTWGGVPFRKPFARMRETVAVLRQMLAGERVSFEGKTVRTKNFRLVSPPDRKSTRLNSSHMSISYAVFCLKKKKKLFFAIFYEQKKKKKTRKI